MEGMDAILVSDCYNVVAQYDDLTVPFAKAGAVTQEEEPLTCTHCACADCETGQRSSLLQAEIDGLRRKLIDISKAHEAEVEALIEAAPQLLEACKGALNCIDPSEHRCTVLEIREAIAAAEGKKP